jgi:hypothetical protein
MTTTETVQATAAPPVTAAVVVLWYRKRRGQPWESVGTYATERVAWAAIQSSARRNGDWTVLPAGREP